MSKSYTVVFIDKPEDDCARSTVWFLCRCLQRRLPDLCDFCGYSLAVNYLTEQMWEAPAPGDHSGNSLSDCGGRPLSEDNASLDLFETVGIFCPLCSTRLLSPEILKESSSIYKLAGQPGLVSYFLSKRVQYRLVWLQLPEDWQHILTTLVV